MNLNLQLDPSKSNSHVHLTERSTSGGTSSLPIRHTADLPRVLIVDDSPTVRKLFSRSLSPRYECLESESAKEALDLLGTGDFAVVITDIIMPGLSGIELLRRVVDEYPDVSVIVASSVDRPQRALDALRIGAFDYLIKPCDPYVLELTVERALERRRLLLKASQYKADLETRNAELAARKAQLEALQVQIVQSEKMASLGRLAAGVAHELNNPVGFIYGNLDLLQHNLNGLKALVDYYEASALSQEVIDGVEALKNQLNYDKAQNETSNMIRDCMEGAERIRGIVQNLRTFSRLDEADFKPTDIHEGIDSTVRLLSTYFGSGNVSLIREYGDLPLVEGFAGQLNQVWMNILANAAQALSETGGEVRISTRHFDDQVEVKIRDTGKGIPANEIDRIFDPFFTTKPLGEGTGLGLSISFGIIEKHHGSISVTSDVGTGTTFTISLPANVESGSVAYDQGKLSKQIERAY
jgi:two-component system, NtrC family, sensor kinase